MALIADGQVTTHGRYLTANFLGKNAYGIRHLNLEGVESSFSLPHCRLLKLQGKPSA